MALSSDPSDIASAWLDALDRAFASGDAAQVAALWKPDGWFRDLLAFGWDLHTQHGTDHIVSYLKPKLEKYHPSDVRIDARKHLEPAEIHMGPATGVQVAFTFRTALGSCRGIASLLPDQSEGNAEWKALLAMVMLDELSNKPEKGHESGLYDGHRLTWPEVRAQRRAEAEANPAALIVGGGQTGLQVAARFGQMGIPYILIDKNKRIGDNWRSRYPTLTLHTTRVHHQLLYAPFPVTWPTYTPKDKVAQWLEQYADTQDLLVWNEAELIPTPTYDASKKRWTATVRRAGKAVTVRPAHIILATGTLGDIRVPQIPGVEHFKGETMHSSAFPGGDRFTGKKVIVIGAGTTAADICQDTANRGAAECTLVQRSSTTVVSSDFMKGFFKQVWPEGIPIEISDFKNAGMPLLFMKNVLKHSMWPEACKHDKDMHDGLRKAGFELNDGPDGAGQLWAIFTTLSGYSLDVGCAKLIAAGAVKVKHGTEPVQFEENALVFSDGSKVDADAVVFATGYTNIRDSMRRVFGDTVIDRTSPVWNVDEEGEQRGCYRPSGQPGLWFAAGDFFHSRALSKQLGLQIQAHELGINDA